MKDKCSAEQHTLCQITACHKVEYCCKPTSNKIISGIVVKRNLNDVVKFLNYGDFSLVRT